MLAYAHNRQHKSTAAEWSVFLALQWAAVTSATLCSRQVVRLGAFEFSFQSTITVGCNGLNKAQYGTDLKMN